MEIKGYERFHIGIKISTMINIQELKSLVVELCNGVDGFEPIETTSIPFNLADLQGFAIDSLFEKDGVNIHINIPSNALNFVGKEPDKVTKVFEEVLGLIISSEKYEEESLSLFYETICDVILSNTKKPSEILKEITNLKLDSFSDMGSLSIGSILLTGEEDGSSDDNSALKLNLSCHPSRPSKDFLLQITKRNKSKEDVLENYEKIKTDALQLIQ